MVRLLEAGVFHLQRAWIARLQTTKVVPLQRAEIIRNRETEATRPPEAGVVRLRLAGIIRIRITGRVHLCEAEGITGPEASTATKINVLSSQETVLEGLVGIAMERALEAALIMEITTITLHHEMRPPVPRTRWPPSTLRPQIQDSASASVLMMDVQVYTISLPSTTPRRFQTRTTYASS